MRLSSEQIEIIKDVIHRFDDKAEIYLFGSRIDDSKRGGDIDLLIFSEKISEKEKLLMRLFLYDKLGEQKIDIVIAKDLEQPFVRIAMNEGIII